MKSSAIALHLDAGGVETYCRKSLDTTRQSAQALAALTALQTVIEGFADGDVRAGESYREIKAIVERYVAAARSKVMADNLQVLLAALHSKDLCGVQQVHDALSRNGFHQAALAAIHLLDRQALEAVSVWASDWRNEAKVRAEATSGFPDALDFKGAGIAVGRYAAMNELTMYLQEALG